MAKKSKKRISNSSVEPQEAEIVETNASRSEAAPAANDQAVKNVVIIIVVLVGIFFLANLIFNRSGKNDKTATDETSQNTDNDKEKSDKKQSESTAITPQSLPDGTIVRETDAGFSYTVGEGESYTTIARRAVAGIDNKLTPAERVAAETKLTTDADAGLLDVGQNVELSKDTIRAAVDWARNLGDEEKAAWQPYADLVAW